MSSARIGVRDWAIALGVAAILLVTGLSEHRTTTGPQPVGYALPAAWRWPRASVLRSPC